MRRLLWISVLVFLGCNRGQTTADSGPAVVAPPATTEAPAATTTAPPPSDAALPPLGGTATAYRPVKLPDGGFAPAPEGGAFAMPTFTVPSGFTMPTAMPSGFPSTLPSGFPTFPPPPAPSK